MISKRTTYLNALLITSLLVVSLFYFLGSRQNEIAPVENSSAVESNIDSNQPSGTTESSKLETRIRQLKREIIGTESNKNQQTSFRNSSDATQAAEVIEQTYLTNEALAKKLEYKLFEQCESYQNSVPKTSLTKSGWFGDKVQGYCAAYSPTISTSEYKNHREVLIKTLHTDTRQTRKIINSLGPTERGDTLARMIVNTRSSDELDIIKREIHRFNKIYRGIPFAELKYPYTYTRYALADPYWAAIDLYSCGKFGGCESDSFYTLMLCHTLGVCDPGWSLYDMYFNTLSANDLANTFTILQFIYDAENSG